MSEFTWNDLLEGKTPPDAVILDELCEHCRRNHERRYVAVNGRMVTTEAQTAWEHGPCCDECWMKYARQHGLNVDRRPARRYVRA